MAKSNGKKGKSKSGAVNPKKVFRLLRSKEAATTTAVNSLEDFNGLWDREWSVYKPVVAQIVKLSGSKLTFTIVLSPDGASSTTQLEVNLDDGGCAWGDLPSTVQLGKAGQYGYLLLTPNWLYENLSPVELQALTGGGNGSPKVPAYKSI